MRMIDEKRRIAMVEIKSCAESIVTLSNVYARAYKDEIYSPKERMDFLDEVWRLITDNQIRLTEVLRENGL